MEQNTTAMASPENGWKITEENFEFKVLQFRERQAGISLVFDPESSSWQYNAYCIETKLLKELFSCEHEFLEDALQLINSEFGTWELVDLSAKKGCGSCVAKGNAH
ncbi:MAG: hypothetical protein RIQ81_764 [Pseudomonadota bacterium]|jgi:hypothetical protein